MRVFYCAMLVSCVHIPAHSFGMINQSSTLDIHDKTKYNFRYSWEMRIFVRLSANIHENELLCYHEK